MNQQLLNADVTVSETSEPTAVRKNPLINFLMNRKRNNQKGLALIDLILWGVGILAVISIIVAMYPKVMHQINITRLDSDLSDIQKAAHNWKGMRNSYAALDIDTLCDDNYLSDTICDDTSIANPWGGAYTAAVNSSNGNRISITVTNIDSNYGNQVADHVAPRTADACSDSDGCSTAAVASNVGTFVFN